jgi:hypothetical protein
MHIVLALDTQLAGPTQLEISEAIHSSFIPRSHISALLANSDVDGILCTALFHLTQHEKQPLL